MSLRFIHGKPGSGKSCYCVSLIVEMLIDWARYKIQENEPYPRSLYTNIPLNVEAINAYVSESVGENVDISEQIIFLGDSFFKDVRGEFRDWWEDFPIRSFVVIDEVQFYLPASMSRKAGGRDSSDKMMEFVSTHRHKQIDMILMSQSVSNVSVEVRRQIETIFEILNVKNTRLGYGVFTIPMEDIDIVRQAWGSTIQMAHIKRGVCQDKTIAYDKTFDVFVLTPKLFALYKSHTHSDDTLDRPSLRLGRLGSLVWIARRHALRLCFWTLLTLTVVYTAWNLVLNFSSILSQSLMKKPAVAAPVQAKPVVSTAADSPIDDRHELHHTPLFADDLVTGFVRNGVITSKGIIRRGDHFIHEGKTDVVSNVDVSRGILYLASGKRVQK